MFPLERIKVLDFSQAMFGPVCTRFLGDWGAEVIKVEPLEGDFTRISATSEDSFPFLICNRNKKSLAVNLKNPKGLEIVYRLVKEIDVLVENFRQGVMGKMGLGYEDISKINPGIIYGSFSAFGETGPMAHWKGGDIWAQAWTGFVASQGSPDGLPYLAGHPVIDYTGAVLNALGIVVALFMRERTGKGQKVSNNTLDTGAFLQEWAISFYLIGGKLLKKGGRGQATGIFPYGAYKARDGDVVTIFGQDDDEWAIVCSILGIEYLLNDPRYDTHERRVERKFELYPIIDEAFSKKTRTEWQEIFRRHGLRCDPCLDYAEFLSHPQCEANDIIVKASHPRYGELKMIGNPVKLSETEHIKTAPSPMLGEHTGEILKELGYREEEIKQLEEEAAIGVLNEKKPVVGALGDSKPLGKREDREGRKR